MKTNRSRRPDALSQSAVPVESRQQAPAGLGVVRQAGGWPYRWLLPPIVAALLVWVAAAIGRARAGMGAPLLVLVVAELVALLWGWRKLRARADRIWLGIAAITTAVWLPVAATIGPWRPGLLLPFLLGAGVLAGWCWRHPWTTARVRVDQDVAAWPHQAGTLGVPGATLQSLQAVPTGRRFVIDLVDGQTWRAIRAETAESVLGTAPGAVSIERDLSSARRVVLHVRDRDPWTQTGVVHPVLSAIDASAMVQADPASKTARRILRDPATAAALSAWRPGSGTVADPIPIGLRPDGSGAALPIWQATTGALHWLIGGKTGAGKSVFFRDLIAGLARCADVELWGIDTGKHGKAFTPWAPVMARIATTPAEAVDLLTDADALVAASARASATEAADGAGTDNVHPTGDTPLVVIMVDEAADLFRPTADLRSEDARLQQRAVELVEGITAKARSEAVSVVLCTQRPDNSSLGGSSVLRSHVTVGVCLQMRNAGDIKWVLSGADAAELDVSLFRYPGLLYTQVGADTLPVPIRDYALLSPADARRVADYLAPGMTRTRRHTNPATTATGAVPAAAPKAQKEIATMPTDTPTPGAEGARPRNAAIAGVLGRIHGYQTEAEADQTSTAPQIALSELADLHRAEEVTEPGDDAARAAILAALREAGPDGMSRAAIHEAIDLRDATVQRLLAAAERAGLASGGDGTGPTVIWRATTAEGEW